MVRCGLCRKVGHNKLSCHKFNSFEEIEIYKIISQTNKGLSMKKRKNCETPWTEYVIALKLLYPYIDSDNRNTLNNIISAKDYLINNPKFYMMDMNNQIPNYYDDLRLQKETDVIKYINNFRVEDLSIHPSLIDKVYLTGKSFSKIPELKLLNTDPLTNDLYNIKITKSDIYVRLINGSFVGISVKTSKEDTLTNYSIEKLFVELGFNTYEYYKNIRISVLKEEFGDNYIYTNSNMSVEEKKAKRKIANSLFYSKDNLYFKEIIQTLEVEERMIAFKNILINYVFPQLPYQTYGFCGSQLKNLNILNNKYRLEDIKIVRRLKEETNTSAKLWYTILMNEEEKYKFEIRGKNDLYGGSMQVFIYKL